MQTHDPDPAKRIPKSLGTDATIVGSYTLADAAVALLPAVLVVLAVQLLVPTDLTLPLVGVAVAVGLGFVAITPSYTSSLEWLTTLIGFYRGRREHDHASAATRTRIERVHRDAVERSDGAFVGLVRVDPPSMALATDEEWERKAGAFRAFLDTTIEFPIQLYATTQAFPVEEYLAQYESRLEDPDVTANPRLARLIEEYVAWYADELDDRRMTIRDHYVVVPVTPSETHFESESGLAKLTRIPVLGVFVDALLAPSVEEERAALHSALDYRLRRVEAGIRAIDGCHATRVPASEAARVITEYWHGHPVEYGDLERVFRTRPLVERAGGRP